MKPDKTKSNSSCDSCNSCGSGLDKLGIDLTKWDYLVALAGNPNTGKSTVFNALTGLRQHTGNWPGKTVTRAEGGFRFEDKRYKIVDLPGTYSLLSMSTDEEIARDFILFGRPECVVVVVDATCTERNLNLVLQILEITDRVIVALNLIDEAKRKGIEVDHRQLSRDLGVPVIPLIAKTGEGLPNLLRGIADVVSRTVRTKPYRIRINSAVKKSVDELVPMIEKAYPGLPNTRWIAMRLLDGDQQMMEAVATDKLASLSEAQPIQNGSSSHISRSSEHSQDVLKYQKEFKDREKLE